MKFIKSLIISSLVFISTATSANNEWTEIANFKWGEIVARQAAVMLQKSNDESSRQLIRSIIGHSSSGIQLIYFTAESIGNLNICLPKDNQSRIARIDGQAVKMLVWCKNFDDEDRYYLEMTAETDDGQKFVEEKFRSSNNTVKFEYNRMTASIPTSGFTSSWNSAGGNAL